MSIFLGIDGYLPPEAETVAPDAVFSVGLGRDYELVAWSARAQITTDLPEQVASVPGYSVGSGTVVVAAPAGSGRGHFGPRGLRVGNLPITVDAALDGVSARVFTGKVSGGSAAASGQQLNLSVEDGMGSLRGEVNLPALVKTFRQGRLGIGLSPRWVMDQILRDAGYYTTPPMEDGCIFSAPLQESIWPEFPTLTPDKVTGNNNIGTGDPVLPEFGSSPFGAHLSAGKVSAQLGSLGFGVGDEYRLCFTVASTTGLTTVGLDTDLWGVGVEVIGSTLTVYVTNDTGASTTVATATFTPGRWCVEIERTGSTSVAYVIRKTSGTVSSGSATIPSTVGTATRGASASALGDSLSGVQVMRNPTTASTYCAHVTGTDLSPSLGLIEAIPVGITGKAKDVLIALAEAEFGAFWFDVDGRPTFRNRDDLIGVGGAVETVTSLDSIADIEWSWNADQTRSAVEIPVTPMVVTSDAPIADGYAATAWTADTAISVPAGVRVEMIVDLDVAVMGVHSFIVPISGDQPTPTYGSYFRCNSDEDGSGVSTTYGVRGRVYQIGPSRLKLVFTGGPGSRWLVDGNGDPRVVIRAMVVARAGSEQTARIDSPGVDADVLRLDENPWRQDVATARGHAVALASRLRSPVATAQQVRVTPNLNRRLGDVILLQDPSVTELNVRCLIVGMNRSGKAGELVEALEVRELPWLIADFNTARTGDSIADFNARHAGETFADFAVDPLDMEA